MTAPSRPEDATDEVIHRPDLDGILADEKTKELIGSLLKNLADWTFRLRQSHAK